MTVRNIASSIYYKWLKRPLHYFNLSWYYIILPIRVKRIRNKEKIKVLFVVSEVASWKTELLYLAMLKHQRFEPILSISTSYVPSGAKRKLEDYLIKKGYKYIDLDNIRNSIKGINPDLIWYYKPYPECYSKGHFFDKNLRYIFCGTNYCFSIAKNSYHTEHEYFDFCWQYYVEHQEIKDYRIEMLGRRAKNTIVSGVPMQDILLLPKNSFPDPWKDKTGKKRIIYAPHHSIQGTNGSGVEFATFLDFGEAILNFAKKYSDKITIAFKPHPNLYMKLLTIWGEDKTKAYYDEWAKLPNTQIETGEYVGLFKYSDAIIHDSASFIVEYLYMDNPSMYLVAATNNISSMYSFIQEGFQCYEHGSSVDDIEQFINNAIEGKDNKKEIRGQYIEKNLLPPGGKTACENIIKSILGN